MYIAGFHKTGFWKNKCFSSFALDFFLFIAHLGLLCCLSKFDVALNILQFMAFGCSILPIVTQGIFWYFVAKIFGHSFIVFFF